MSMLNDYFEHGCVKNNKYSSEISTFREQVKKEVESLDFDRKEEINAVSYEELIMFINKKSESMVRVMMMSMESMRYPYLCMELMERMKTLDEKYAVCRFFQILVDSKGQSRASKLMSDAFFTPAKDDLVH